MVSQGVRCRVPDADVQGDTTLGQTEHNTDLVIHYAWHPWAGQTVRMVMPYDRASELCFRVDRIVGEKTSVWVQFALRRRSLQLEN